MSEVFAAIEKLKCYVHATRVGCAILDLKGEQYAARKRESDGGWDVWKLWPGSEVHCCDAKLQHCTCPVGRECKHLQGLRSLPATPTAPKKRRESRRSGKWKRERGER